MAESGGSLDAAAHRFNQFKSQPTRAKTPSYLRLSENSFEHIL